MEAQEKYKEECQRVFDLQNRYTCVYVLTVLMSFVTVHVQCTCTGMHVQCTYNYECTIFDNPTSLCSL